MAKQTCMICNRSAPFDYIMRDDERPRFPDPDKTELEIHIKRNHSIEDMQKFINPTEFNRKKALKTKMVKENLQEQEGEPDIKTDDLVAELFAKSASKSSSGTTTGKSTKRGGSSKRSASRKSKRSVEKSKPTVLVSDPSAVVGMAKGNATVVKDASSADL